MIKYSKKGFTLIELIIVIAIIGILAAIAVPKFGSIQRDSKIKADIASAKTIADAAAVLLTQDKISSAASPFVLISTKNTITGTSTDAEKAQNAMIDYLQNIPTPQVPGATGFTVVITSNEVTINAVGSVGTDTKVTNPQLYPNPDTTAYPK